MKLEKILGWGFGGLFGLNAIAAVWSQPAIAAIFAAWSLVCLPPVNQLAAERGLRLSAPIKVAVFLLGVVVAGAIASSQPTATAPPQPAPLSATVAPPSSVAAAPETPAPLPAAPPEPAAEAEPKAGSWRSHLPEESAELRAKYEQDPFLGGWLSVQNVWIGYADSEDLLNRGFFVNAQFKHNGLGAAPEGVTHGSCSAIGFDGEFICGVGAFDSPDWGIQNEEAIERFKSLM